MLRAVFGPAWDSSYFSVLLRTKCWLRDPKLDSWRRPAKSLRWLSSWFIVSLFLSEMQNKKYQTSTWSDVREGELKVSCWCFSIYLIVCIPRCILCCRWIWFLDVTKDFLKQRAFSCRRSLFEQVKTLKLIYSFSKSKHHLVSAFPSIPGIFPGLFDILGCLTWHDVAQQDVLASLLLTSNRRQTTNCTEFRDLNILSIFRMKTNFVSAKFISDSPRISVTRHFTSSSYSSSSSLGHFCLCCCVGLQQDLEDLQVRWESVYLYGLF